MSECANIHVIKVNASVAESIYPPLMFPSMQIHHVFNRCRHYLKPFMLLLIIGSVDSKNRKAITKGGNKRRGDVRVSKLCLFGTQSSLGGTDERRNEKKRNAFCHHNFFALFYFFAEVTQIIDASAEPILISNLPRNKPITSFSFYRD